MFSIGRSTTLLPYWLGCKHFTTLSRDMVYLNNQTFDTIGVQHSTSSSKFSSTSSRKLSSDASRELSSDSSRSIVYLNVSHNDQSLVAIGAQHFIDNLKGQNHVTQINLMDTKALVPFTVKHSISLRSVLIGEGSSEDKERVAPVLSACDQLNNADILLISTPMWNYSCPYVLKQYIDTVLQPQLTFNDVLPPEETAIRNNRSLVTFTSAGFSYSEDGPLKDFLNPYIQQVFGVMGFRRYFPVIIEALKIDGEKRTRENMEAWTKERAKMCAEEMERFEQIEKYT